MLLTHRNTAAMTATLIVVNYPENKQHISTYLFEGTNCIHYDAYYAPFNLNTYKIALFSQYSNLVINSVEFEQNPMASGCLASFWKGVTGITVKSNKPKITSWKDIPSGN